MVLLCILDWSWFSFLPAKFLIIPTFPIPKHLLIKLFSNVLIHTVNVIPQNTDYSSKTNYCLYQLALTFYVCIFLWRASELFLVLLMGLSQQLDTALKPSQHAFSHALELFFCYITYTGYNSYLCVWLLNLCLSGKMIASAIYISLFISTTYHNTSRLVD